MALEKIKFEFDSKGKNTIPKEWVHTGVVGSGDMEIILSHKEQNGKISVVLVTPVTGFNHIWEKVINKFLTDNELSDLLIEINDNNSTPFIASMRLKQCLAEAMEV